MSEWWEKSVHGRTRISRWLSYSWPFRRRFGQRAGWRLARDFSAVEYRAESGQPLSLAVPGWSDPVWIRPGTTDPWVFRQLILGGELDLDMPAPRRIIDAGANIGLATRIFLRRWPDAEIAAVEMEAGNCEVLRTNTVGHAGVSVVQAALWSSSGTVFVDPGDYGEAGYRVEAAPNALSVAAWSVVDLLDTLEWDWVDLVKLDIEGAEREVLADASRWLPRTKHLLVELHERFAPGCIAAFERALPATDWHIQSHGEYLFAQRRSGQ